MRPVDPATRAALTTALRTGPIDAPRLAAASGLSARTVLRALAEYGDSVIAAGAARRRRYALRRLVRGHDATLALYAIDAQGRASELAPFALLQPQGSWCPLRPAWPIGDEARDGWWPGLPYPLHDMQPQGYLGRQLARALHETLGVDVDPARWDDESVVHVLAREGSDCAGNLVLGDASLRQWQSRWQNARAPVDQAALPGHYAALADGALLQGAAGSSAAGEFPKFTSSREAPAGSASATPHVIVKFSGADSGAATRRWASLLVCEHLAIGHAGALQGVRASSCRVLQARGRTFLESERFDRLGEQGRLALASLQSASDHLLGLTTQDWPAHAAGLVRLGHLDAQDAQAIERLWWFGRLIANSDMHLGNLALFVEGGRLRPAPVFDMLPMRYAPLAGGEVPTLAPWQPPLPLPAQAAAWRAACGPALAFWHEAAADPRVDEGLRPLFTANAGALETAAGRV